MDLSTIFRLALAVVFGGAIGLERQLRDKPAGLRTNILICVGAAQFMVISTQAARIFGGDPMRIAAQIITGIGFLGAGAVLHSHGVVKGLTSAATVWIVAGIGMAVGSGLYGTATAATILTIGTLSILTIFEQKLELKGQVRYSLVVDSAADGITALNRILKEHHIETANLNFRREGPKYHIWFQIRTTSEKHSALITKLSAEPSISQVETAKKQAIDQNDHFDVEEEE